MSDSTNKKKMEIDFIVLWKKKERKNSNIKDSFLSVLQNRFERVNDPYIRLFVDGNKERVTYQMSGNDTDILYFKVFHHGTEMQSARILDAFSSQLLNGKHRKEFSIITTYDEPSQAYCSKMMPLFGKFERRLRELVYITVVKAFGIEWFEKTFNNELKQSPELKQLSEDKLVEGALGELTFSAMQMYLFKPFPDLTSEDAIRKINDGKDDYSREEILGIISQTEKKSLWERFFTDQTELEDFHYLLEELRKKRNKVMHGKRFSREEMIETRKILRDVNKKLEQAIGILDKRHYDNRTIQDMVGAFASMVSASHVFEDYVKYYAESIAPSMQSLQAAISSVPIPDLQRMTGMSKVITELQRTLSSPMMETIKSIQETQKIFADSIQMKEIARLGNLLTSTYYIGETSGDDSRTEKNK